MNVFRKWMDTFRGAGEAAVTVPSMDGALKPNRLLDGAAVAWQGGDTRIANLATDGARIYFSHGRQLYAMDEGAAAPQRIGAADGDISAVSAHPSGIVAVGLAGGGLLVMAVGGEFRPLQLKGMAFDCPVAIAFIDAETLVVANGSATNAPAAWCRDLMERNRSGSVWRVGIRSGEAQCLARDLGFPSGVAVAPSGAIVVSESWRHQLILVEAPGKTSVVLEDLPGYPGSISRGRSGYWLSVFAPRRQLIEFVLREDGYRRAMLETLDEQYWVAPSLKTGVDYFEPVQSGSVRHLGIVKPWAPTRSYGLLVHLDDEFNPQASYHSRADASRHGITSAVERGTDVLLTCAATHELLALDPTIMED